MQRVKNLIFSQTSKDTTILFVGNGISSLLAVIFAIYIGRKLGPQNLGIGMALVSFVTIISSIADFGLTSSLFRFLSKTHHSFIFTIRLFSSLLIASFLIVFSKPLSLAIYKIQDSYLVILSAIAILGFLLWDFQIQSFQSKKKFFNASVFLILSNLLRVILIILLDLSQNLNLETAIAAFAISPFVIFFATLPFNKVHLEIQKNWKNISLEIAPFSGWMWLTKIAGSISGRIDTLLLIQLLPAFDVGIYSASRQLAQGIPIFIGSFATVLAPRFVSLEKTKLNTYYKKTIILSLLISLGLILIVPISPIVSIIFGEKYSSSIPVFRMLLISFIPLVLSTPPVNFIIYALKKPKIISFITLIELPIMIIGTIMLIPIFTIFAPIITIGIINTFTLVSSFLYILFYKNEK